jgi:hypothetical protein
MEKTLTELCEYLNNYFWRVKRNVKITISDGTFNVDFLKEGQYFRILGSDLNDGVYQYPVSDLKDEIFVGSIWSMAVPQSVIDLANDIEEWQSKYGSVESDAMSPFNSESFGNYSYSKDGSASGSGSVSPNSWQSVFKSRLNPWRRLRNI